jgi:hypothetical protein
MLKNKKTIILNGLDYSLVRVYSKNNVNPDTRTDNLHFIGYNLTILQQVKNQWYLTATLYPSISSSLDNGLKKEDFLFNSRIGMLNRKSEIFSYGFGLLLTSKFGRPLLVPNFTLTNNSGNNRLYINLPLHISYQYSWNMFELGMDIDVAGSKYNTNIEYIAEDGIEYTIGEIQYSRITMGPHVSYRLKQNVRIDLQGGMTFNRTLKFSGDEFDNEDYTMKKGAFFQLGISILPRIKNNNFE